MTMAVESLTCNPQLPVKVDIGCRQMTDYDTLRKQQTKTREWSWSHGSCF